MDDKLVYGTAWKGDQTADLVYAALQAGFRALATAAQPRHYREDLVGDGIRRAVRHGLVTREDLFIQTTFTPAPSQDPANLPYDPAAPVGDQVDASLAHSLATLATVVPPNDDDDEDSSLPPRPYLDALVLHVPYRDPAHTQQAWLAMSRAVRAGHVRQLGISNASRADLVHLVAWCRRGGGATTTTTTQAGAGAGDGAAVGEPLVVVPPTIVQNRFYPGPEGDFDHAARKYCSSGGSIMTYQAFGLLRNKALVEDEASVGAVARVLGFSRPVALYALVTEALGQQGDDIRVLDGTTRADRMEEDVAGVKRAVAALRRAKRTSTSTVTPPCAGNDDDVDDDEALNRAMVSFRMGFGQDEME